MNTREQAILNGSLAQTRTAPAERAVLDPADFTGHNFDLRPSPEDLNFDRGGAEGDAILLQDPDNEDEEVVVHDVMGATEYADDEPNVDPVHALEDETLDPLDEDGLVEEVRVGDMPSVHLIPEGMKEFCPTKLPTETRQTFLRRQQLKGMEVEKAAKKKRDKGTKINMPNSVKRHCCRMMLWLLAHGGNFKPETGSAASNAPGLNVIRAEGQQFMDRNHIRGTFNLQNLRSMYDRGVWSDKKDDVETKSTGWLVHYQRGDFNGNGDDKKVCLNNISEYPFLEELVKTWFDGERKAKKLVTFKRLHMVANKISKDQEDLMKKMYPVMIPGKISESWVRGFIRRQGLLYRFVQRMTKYNKETLKEPAQKFWEFIYRCHRLYDYDFVVNMDEIPMAVSGCMCRKVRTFMNGKGDSEEVDMHPADFKRGASVCGCGATKWNPETKTWEPHFVPPMMLFAGTGARDKGQYAAYGAKIAYTAKSVITANAMLNDFLPHLKRYTKVVRDGQEVQGKVLLVMDLAPGHKTEAVVKAYAKEGITIAFIPGGTTSWMQWIDVYCASKLRNHMFNAFCGLDNRVSTAVGRRELMTKLVMEAMKELFRTADSVKQFQHLGYIQPAEGHIHLHHGMGEVKFIRANVKEEELVKDDEALAKAKEDARKTVQDMGKGIEFAQGKGVGKGQRKVTDFFKPKVAAVDNQVHNVVDTTDGKGPQKRNRDDEDAGGDVALKDNGANLDV